MDPNATLDAIRTLVGEILNDERGDETAAELADLIDVLDEWMVSGGFAPELWSGKYPVSGRNRK